MKPAAIAICLSAVLAVRLPAQEIDLDAARSEAELRAGVQAFHRGLLNESIVAFEKAVSYQPSAAIARNWLGRALLRSGYEQQAARTWESLVQAGGGGALLRDQLAVLRMRSGLGRELAKPGPFAVSARLEGAARGGHPFRRPTSVRPRADGSFFVVAFGSNEVLRYDANFRLSAALTGGLEGYDKPWDVLEAADGTLYISEYGGNRIARCGPGGERISSFGKKGRGNGALLGPQYLAADGRGYLYVTDWGNSRVAKFAVDGTWILNVAGLSGPTGVAVRDERLYVSERAAKRVSVFDLDGNPLATLGEGVLTGPEGLSFTRRGTLLVADGNLVREFDVENEAWSVRADPAGASARLVQQAMGANGDVLAADFDGSRVLLFSDATALAGGLAVRVVRVSAVRFPEVFLDVTVETRMGEPVVGLEINNFIITESRYAVREAALVQSNTAPATLDAAIVVERSPAFDRVGDGAAALVGELRDLVSAAGRALAVSAGEKAVRETDFGEARLRMTSRVLGAAPSASWRFDLAARLAGDCLVQATSMARRAVLFLTSGSLGGRPFRTYSLEEVAAFYRNNAIAFYAVVVGAGAVDEDLAFLAAETGGRVFSATLPGGMAEVVRTMRSRVSPTYTIRFLSPSNGAFGTKYIPLEVEATLQKVSGRDEAGYYSPPSD